MDDNRVAIRENALDLFRDRGLVNPEIEHEIPYMDDSGGLLLCARGDGDQRDWLIAS